MSSLFRDRMGFLKNKRENDVKDSLINTLQENVRVIQYEANESKEDVIGMCESSSSLSIALEAIFLHGLKDSTLWLTLNALSDNVDRRPEPSFWPPVMVFLHKQVIEQVQNLSQINTETGQCRAWIRLSLNDCLLSAYMKNMRSNSSALSSYYRNYALIKDAERLDIIARIMEGLESSLSFNLPVNTSLLNQWPDLSLQLSALWTPPLKSIQIASGVDIAGTISAASIDIPTPKPLDSNEFFSESISNSPFQRQIEFPHENKTVTEKATSMDDMLKKIQELELLEDEHVTKVESSEDFLLKLQLPGNSIANRMHTSWSEEPESPEDLTLSRSNLKRSLSNTSSTSSLRTSINRQFSYNALLKNHENTRAVDWTEIWEKFILQNPTPHMSQRQSLAATPVETQASDMDDFELLNDNMQQFDVAELQYLVEQLCQLSHEPGLNVQGFACKDCQHPLGICPINYQVCAFTGNYYCKDCIAPEAMIIPAFVINNWDFGKYTISKRVAIFLNEFCDQPFIDFKLLNPKIYEFIDTMAQLQKLRIRLNFIRTYLITCRNEKIMEDMQRQFYGKEYLYEHIHQYSVADLNLIRRGKLQSMIEKFCKSAEQHILNCVLCSVKGFICEICRAAQVLYPFHIETTFRCNICGSVFHPACLNEKQPCPKCLRKRKREEAAEQQLELEN